MPQYSKSIPFSQRSKAWLIRELKCAYNAAGDFHIERDAARSQVDDLKEQLAQQRRNWNEVEQKRVEAENARKQARMELGECLNNLRKTEKRLAECEESNAKIDRAIAERPEVILREVLNTIGQETAAYVSDLHTRQMGLGDKHKYKLWNIHGKQQAATYLGGRLRKQVHVCITDLFPQAARPAPSAGEKGCGQ